MNTDLNNKVAIISGSTRGIGNGIARMFASHGAAVVITGRDPHAVERAVTELQQNNFTAMGYSGDLTVEHTVQALVAQVEATYGVVDILVNNIGATKWKRFEEMEYAQWRSEIEANLESVLLPCKSTIPLMKKSHAGRIINISSSSVLRVREGGAAYISAKTGMIGLTRTLALELGPYGITANAIAPGLVRTDLTASLYDETAFEGMGKQTPLGRLASVKDVASAALYLASPLGQFVTGQVLAVDGGLSLK